MARRTKTFVDVYGTKLAVKALRGLAKQYPNAARSAIYAEGLEIMADSQAHTPVDTGRLRATGTVTKPRRTGDPEVMLGYGTDYAVYVHERTELRHNPPTEAKFLENAFKRAVPGMLDRLGKRIIARSLERDERGRFLARKRGKGKGRK